MDEEMTFSEMVELAYPYTLEIYPLNDGKLPVTVLKLSVGNYCYAGYVLQEHLNDRNYIRNLILNAKRKIDAYGLRKG